jgi:hypothetical protein
MSSFSHFRSRATPRAACASGHSEAMNCVKPASAARAGVFRDWL